MVDSGSRPIGEPGRREGVSIVQKGTSRPDDRGAEGLDWAAAPWAHYGCHCHSADLEQHLLSNLAQLSLQKEDVKGMVLTANRGLQRLALFSKTKVPNPKKRCNFALAFKSESCKQEKHCDKVPFIEFRQDSKLGE